MSTIMAAIQQLPSLGKYVLILVLALNAHSLPFVWHFRFWWRLVPRMWIVWTKSRQAYLDQRTSEARAHGGLGARTRTRRRAWFDDCDFNMHLSNSCYAKNADYALSAWTFDNLTPFFEAGGYQALGGTHYTFIREIPILSEYYTESRMIGGGDKWYYLVTEFIIYPKKKSTKGSKARQSAQSHASGAVTPASAGPSAPTSGAATPPEVTLPGTTDVASPRSNDSAGGVVKGNEGEASTTALADHALAALRSPRTRADGGVVAGIAVHELCMKIGRITVPPRIGFHLSGFSPSKQDQKYARQIASTKKGSAAWLSGGWKSDERAAQLGRDILPCVSDSASAEKTAMSVEDAVREHNERAVKGMEAVSLGLGEVTHL